MGLIRTELAPFPGREEAVLRFVVATALVIVISMALEVPSLPLSLIMVFFTAQENTVLTRLSGIVLMIGATIAVVIGLLLVKFTINYPMLRILAIGCALGSVVALVAAIFIIPHLDSIAGLLVLTLPIVAVGAWIAAGSPRTNYIGVQFVFAYALSQLGHFAPTTDLTEIRDRMIGILVGAVVSIAVSTWIWPERESDALKQMLARLLRSVAGLARAGGGKLGTYALEALLEQARDVRRNLVAASQARTARGLEPRTHAETAQAQLLQLDQQITVAQTRVRSLREGLRALTGAGPDDLPAIAPRPLPDSAGGVPSSLGYELLARRPDLQAMRWYGQASMDQIDAAKAAFYPSFDIRAFLGLDSLHLADLLRRSSRQINVIPGLSLPIFDSGRLNANLAATRSQSNALIAQYNESVLNAVREVAQAGIELDGLNRQAAMQEGKLKSVSFASNSAEAHYRQGLLDKPSALEARLPLLMEQSQAVEIRSKQIQSDIALTRALGGGYTSGQSTQ
ncbi:FUSC family protein [Cupriavidus sp. UME77]|uniref:FUSC family protein n=1 Tax=Cupriavidus sp. UME77 TaxID=1862321 RepID=UPI0016029383|nr:FUSC family protein [Cupriavidus sp. UME77]MBB1635614.1 hypothetical protein [Cupriavidus sp. UME77]